METKLNNKIDKRLPVSWCLEMDTGELIFDKDTHDRTYWLKIKELLKNSGNKIKRMHMFSRANAKSENEFDGANTPTNCVGYFYSKKILAQYGGPSFNLYGLGYVNNNGLVTILWYDDHMSLIEREERPIDKCQLGLILNHDQRADVSKLVC